MEERSGKRLHALGAAGVLVVTALINLHPFSNYDFFWHLAVGRHVAERGELPTTNLWTFTAPDYPFAATSWLFDLTLWGLWQLGEANAVHLFVVFLVSVTFAL